MSIYPNRIELLVAKFKRRKRKPSILVMHDCPFPLAEWTDENFSMSWIDVLAQLHQEYDWTVSAIGSTGPNKSESSIRNVRINFYPTDELWSELYKQLRSKPDVLLLNIMDYNSAALRIGEVKKLSPKTKIVFRIHHEPFRLAYLQPGFINSLRHANLTITPMPFYNSFLFSLLDGNIISIPFGARNLIAGDKYSPKLGSTNILSVTKNENPGKNFEIAKKLSELSTIKTRFTYHVDITKDEMIQLFGNATHFFQPSLSEASGSRILMEAFQFGLIPIVFQNSLSCAYIVKDCGGIVLPLKIPRNYLDRKNIYWKKDDAIEIMEKIEILVDSWLDDTWIPPYFQEDFEIIALTKTLRHLVEEDPENDLSLVIDHIIDNTKSRALREELSAEHILH